MLDVPAVVRNKARAAGAQEWVDHLPELVNSLTTDWDLTIGRTFHDASEALVVEATTVDGTAAVLKLIVPRDGDAARHEITVLRLAHGEGCAALLRDDVARGALLVERLGPSMHDLRLPLHQRLELLTAAASRVWRPAPHAGLPTGAEKAAWLEAHITRLWEELDHPCSERAVAHALECAARRAAAHDVERAVLVHGDVHQWNALQAGDGFKLVDPDGLLVEAEYDLGVMMREDPEDLLAGDPTERARWFASRTELDVTAIWEWGVVERVSTGLLCVGIGLMPVGADMLRAADAVAGVMMHA